MPLKSKVLEIRNFRILLKTIIVNTIESLLCFNLFKPSQQNYGSVPLFPFSRWENWHPHSQIIYPMSPRESNGAESKPRLSDSRTRCQIASSWRKRMHFLGLIFLKNKIFGRIHLQSPTTLLSVLKHNS